MKNIFALVLALLLSVEAWGGSTYKADLYTSSLQNTPTELKSQNRTTNGVGNATSISGGNALGAGNVGGDVTVDGGAGGAGASKGKLISNTLLKFGTAPDNENGHIRNNSNTPIMIVDQSNQSAFLGAFAGAFSGTYTGNQNTALGHQTMTNLTSGASNTAVGYQAMQPWTDGSDNTAVGAAALSTSSSGNRNVAIGAQAMNNATNAASENVAIGRQAGFAMDGGESVMIGHRAGLNGNPATTSSGVTFLGARAGLATATQHNFLTTLGYDAKGECDDCVILGRTTDVVGIGLLDPPGDGALHVNGEFRIGSSAAYVGLNVAAPTTYSITLPGSAPVAGQVLTATSATATSWATPGGNVVSPIVSLIADNQAVDVSGLNVIPMDSDDPVAANRTFTLSNPVNGQQIVLVWISSNQGELLDDSAISGGGNVRLSGDWFPALNGTLTLSCNDSVGLVDCYEISRSSN